MSKSVLYFLSFLVLCYSCGNRINKKTDSSTVNILGSKTITFSGFTWIVSHSTTPAAPGPNFWNEENVWVDGEGRLHLKLNKDQNGIWSCAEIKSTQLFGLGDYEFRIEAAIDKMDPNVVLGLFNYSGRDHRDEIDIEFSKWGRYANNNLHYTVYPKKRSQPQWSAKSIMNLNGSYSTHRFQRYREKIAFQSLHGFQTGDEQEIFSAVCTNEDIINTQAMPIYMNLWLYNGLAPTDDKQVEIIIHRFRFKSL